jgi:hypothetical protein
VKHVSYRGDHSADIEEPIDLDGAMSLVAALAYIRRRFVNAYSDPVTVSFVIRTEVKEGE